MPYNDRQFKTTNVNYLNKDFDAFKSNLIQYAKTYFPNTYKDFNETSPGMMLLEMSAYVGDVLSFYIDQQFQEMMLPLAEERRNVINLANMLGYKVKPSVPSYSTITVKYPVGVLGTAIENNIRPDYGDSVVIDKGWVLKTSDNIHFETLDVVDFTVSTSLDISHPPVENAFDGDGIVTEYQLTRKVKAVSCVRKTTDFTIGTPQQYRKLTIPDTNVIDIVSVIDMNNGNRWHEVDYLAQDKIPVETHYREVAERLTAWSDFSGDRHEIATPYTLNYLKTGKRFITQVNDDNTTSLVFGNGVLRNGQFTDVEFSGLAAAGMIFPGTPTAADLDISLDPLAGDTRMTLGETPNNTTLRITYRVGGGNSANVSANSIDTSDVPTLLAGSLTNTITVTNEEAAFGGSDAENIEELRHRALAHFKTQNRCVTKEDYEARIMNLPSKFGNIAKVFVDRVSVDAQGSSTNAMLQNLDFDSNQALSGVDYTAFKAAMDASMMSDSGYTTEASDAFTQLSNFFDSYESLIGNIGTENLATLDVYVLGYDSSKVLTALPPSEGGAVNPLKQNIKEYIDNYRMVTDQLNILDGRVVNFGVAFDVVSHKTSNAADVKLRCINKIIEYFNIDKMQFRQPIHTSEIEYELMGIEGVRSVNWLQLTQDFHHLANSKSLPGLSSDTYALYEKSYTFPDGDPNGNVGYGWQYDFNQFYEGDNTTNGIILPSATPSVFELKYPKQNVRGVVR